MIPLPDPRMGYSPEGWDEMVLLFHRHPGGRSDLGNRVQAAKESTDPKIKEILWWGEPERCSFDERPSDYWWPEQKARPWRFTERRLAKFFLVSQDVPGFRPGQNWSEINDHKGQVVEGYGKIGYEVEIWLDDSESLLGMLRDRADLRIFLAHGDQTEGVRCTDRFVSWEEVQDNIGPTGLSHFMSCWSHDAEVSDDDGSYPFEQGLLHAGCSAVILTHDQSHEIPGNAKSGGLFEIQRLLGILDRCHKLGLKAAMEAYRSEYEGMLGPIGASIIVDHEVAAGDPSWGVLD